MFLYLTLKESRGGGDNIEINIENNDSIKYENKCFKILSKEEIEFIIPEHNLLFFVISENRIMNTGAVNLKHLDDLGAVEI